MDTTQTREIDRDFFRKTIKLEAPEGGWGIVITFSMAIMFIVTVGPLAAFGIIYGKFLASLGDESGYTSLVCCVFNTVLNFMGLIANSMLQKYSYRYVGILGGIFFFLGNFLAAFSTSLSQLIITFGVLQGIGFGFMLCASFEAFNKYFIARKNIMMGISQTLVAAASMTIPYFCRMLMDSYGFRGTVLIMSALSLHGLWAMVTLQPVEWHMRKIPITSAELSFLPEEKLTVDGDNNEKTNIEKFEYEREDRKFSLKEWILNFFEVDLLKDITYVNISIGLSLSFLSDIMFQSLLPAILGHRGYNNMDVTFFVTVFMVADLVGRILLSCFRAFFTSFKNRHLFLIGTAAVTIVRIALTITTGDWSWIFFVCMSLGLLRCLIQVTIPLVLADYSQDRFAAVFGLYQTISGVIGLIIGPLSGIIASVSSSDIWLMHMLTSMLLLCVIPWLAEYLCLYFKK